MGRFPQSSGGGGGAVVTTQGVGDASGTDYTSNSQAFVDVSNGATTPFNLSIGAAAGDVLECLFSGVFSVNAAGAVFFGIAVAGAVKQSWVESEATIGTGNSSIESFGCQYTVQGADISGGTVAVHLQWKTSAPTCIADLTNSATEQPVFSVKNLRH